MDFSKIQDFGKNISSSFTPFASRTQQYVREQLGQAEEKVSLPTPSSIPAPAARSDGSVDISPTSPIRSPPSLASSDTITPSHIPRGSRFLRAILPVSLSASHLVDFIRDVGIVHRIRRKLTESKTQLPPDYLELEKRVDALKSVHQKMLAVTSQYGNERESIVDLSRSTFEKVQLLSNANTAAEAQNILTKPGTKSAPKTFPHALGRASLAASHSLDAAEPLATALEKYALASEQVGEARLQQDAQIISRFNAAFSTTLNTNLLFATKARKNVENARLSLDAAKSRVKSGGGMGFPGLGSPGRKDGVQEDEGLTEEQRVEVETAEDEFVGFTEEAVGVMKNVLDTPEPLRNLADLVQAQLEFHKKANEIYSDLAPLIESLQIEQEV